MKGAWGGQLNEGESKNCTINDLHLPGCVSLKCWTRKLRRFSTWPVGKNSSACTSDTVAIYYLRVGRDTTDTSGWNQVIKWIDKNGLTPAWAC